MEIVPGGLLRCLEVWEQFWWGETQKNNHGFWGVWNLKPWSSVIFCEVLPYASGLKKAHSLFVALRSHIVAIIVHPDPPHQDCQSGPKHVCLISTSMRKQFPRNAFFQVSDLSGEISTDEDVVWNLANRNIQLSQCDSKYPNSSYSSKAKSYFNRARVERDSSKDKNKHFWENISE